MHRSMELTLLKKNLILLSQWTTAETYDRFDTRVLSWYVPGLADYPYPVIRLPVIRPPYRYPCLGKSRVRTTLVCTSSFEARFRGKVGGCSGATPRINMPLSAAESPLPTSAKVADMLHQLSLILPTDQRFFSQPVCFLESFSAHCLTLTSFRFLFKSYE